MPSKKKLIISTHRKAHHGHYFKKGIGPIRQGGMCRCGLTKQVYTLKLCSGKTIPKCVRKETNAASK